MADLTLAVRLVGDGKSLSGTVQLAEKDLRRLDKTVDDVGRTARNTQGATEQLGRGLSALRSHMLGLIGIWAAGQAREFVSGLAEASLSVERVNRALAATAGARAGAEYEFVRQTAHRLGLDLATTADAFTKLSASAMGTRLAGEQAQQIFTAVAQAAATLGLSAAETQGALTAIGQMMSKGTVSAEELRGQLGERLPGAFQVAARAMGVTTAELGKMLEQGQILAEDFLPRFAREMQRSFGGEVAGEVRTAAAEFARMKTAALELQAAIGDRLVPSLAGGASAVANIARAMREAANESGLLTSLWVGLGGAASETWKALFGGEQEQSARQLKDQIAGLKDELALTERQIRSIEASPFYLGDKWKQIGGLQSKAYDLRDALRQAQAALDALQRTGTGSPLERELNRAEADQAAMERAYDQARKRSLDRIVPDEAFDAVERQFKDLDKQTALAFAGLAKVETGGRQAARGLSLAARESRAGAEAAARHAERLRDTATQLNLEYVELTRGARARKELELATEGLSEAEQQHLLTLYDRNEALKATQDAERAAAEASRKLAEEQGAAGKVIERTAERMTDAFAEFFTDVFTDGVKAFKDLGGNIKSLFLRLLGDLAAAALANPIRILIGAVTGGLAGTASAGTQAAAGGLLSSLGSAGSWLGGLGTLTGIGGSGLGIGYGLSTAASLVGDLGYVGAFGPSMAAAGGALGAGQIGLAASLAAPYLLPAIGVGLLASKLLKKKKKPPRSTLASGTQDYEDDVFVEGAFGALGLRARDTTKVDAEKFRDTLQGLADLDTYIAGFLDRSLVQGVTQALDGWAAKTDQKANEFGRMVSERYQYIFDRIDAGLAAAFARNATDETAAEAARDLTTLWAAIQPAKEVLGPFATRLKELRVRFDDLTALARQYAYALEEVQAASVQATRALTEEFNQGVQDAILALTDPTAAALQALDREYQAMRRDAEAIGADLVALERLYGLKRAEILKQTAESGLDSLIDGVRERLGGIREWLAGQAFSDTSSLSPSARFAEAQRQFAAQSAAARGGDAAALQALTGSADTLLASGLGMFARSSAQYAGLERMVRSQVAETGIQYADMTLAQQTDVLHADLAALRTEVEALRREVQLARQQARYAA